VANIITEIRIVLSAALLFRPALSPGFYALYIAAGFSDMIDGAVARRTGTASELGSRLDTIADIALIKLANIAAGYIRHKEFISVHSVINKVTGLLLFVFPLTLTFIDLRYSAAVVCMVATAAAIQEGYMVTGAYLLGE
jgi:CDP-diacylglycerol--glycerol-3-phosphate 3-phosphatidyltransferase